MKTCRGARRADRAARHEAGGDRAETYFERTECVAGVQDMRFQELMPDALHWLGVSRIDRFVSMSNMKHDAMARQGEFESAIDAYEQVIELDPENLDAAYNRDLLQQLQEQQQQQDQGEEDGEQDQQQMEKDKYECYQWAKQQTGFDPMQQPTATSPPPQQQAQKGGVGRGAVRGGAVGVAAGAIAGDAGKGAAIGAASGALIGGMRRQDQRRQGHGH